MMLLPEVSRFLRETGMPRTVFGRLAVNDKRFVDDLLGGRQPRPETAAHVRSFMAAQAGWRPAA